jgi:hypothetical protein
MKEAIMMTCSLFLILLLLPAASAFLMNSPAFLDGNHASSPISHHPLLSHQPQDDAYYNEDEYYEQQGQQYYEQNPPPPQQHYYDEWQPPQQQYYDEQSPQQQDCSYYHQNEPPSREEPAQGLYLGDDVEEQIKSLTSKFPTSEADYLAAARKRAEEARASINNEASDEDWQQVAHHDATTINDDGWESSIALESEILLPKLPTQGGKDGGEEEEEPTLLL